VREDYPPGVLAPSQKSASEIAARDAFNREHPPIEGLVVEHDLRKMDLPERPWRNTEAYLYCVKGRGFTVVNYEGEPEQVIEWSEGTLFAPPRWAWHQHFNLDTGDTSRYLAVQDTGLLRTMRLHQIERHPVQLSPEEAAQLLAASR
jgi:hypothetical protein